VVEENTENQKDKNSNSTCACYVFVKKIYFFKNRSYSFADTVLSAIPTMALTVFDPGIHRFPYGSLYRWTAIDSIRTKIKCISTKNIIVRKLDYHTSEEPVDLFLTTLLGCNRQQ